MLKLTGTSILTAGFTFILLSVAAIGNIDVQNSPNQADWQVYSSRESVLRLHVIASSDAPEDQALKEQVVGLVRRQLSGQENFNSVEDCLCFVQQALPRLEQEVKAYVQQSAPGQQVSLALTRSNFPLRAYGTSVLPPGEYPALKVVLGTGQGENWWCLLFPPLCITLAEPPPVDEPATSGNDREATGHQEPVRWRLKIWEWLEMWF